MKTSNIELQQYAFILAKSEYEELVKYNNSEEAKLARMCEVDNTYRSMTFIEELLLRSFPYVASNEEVAKELIKFADKTAGNGDAFIVELIVGQIEQSEFAVKFAKDWAERQIKEFYQN